MFCTESPDDWRRTSDIGVATIGKTYWYLTDNSGTEGWIGSDATSGARACRRRDWQRQSGDRKPLTRLSL